MGKWLNAGQTCVAPDYIMVHKDIEKEFLAKMTAKLQEAFDGNPEASVDFGNVINSRHTSRVARLIESTKAKVITGGANTADPAKHYLAPTILQNPEETDPIMVEEIFGPVLPVKAVEDELEAIGVINRVCDKPLALYIYAEDNAVVQRVMDKTLSGGVCVNSCMEHMIGGQMPFGGVGESGMGAYHGKAGFDEFSHRRSVMYKDTTILKQAMPYHHLPAGMYDKVIKFLIVGLSTTEKLVAGVAVVAVAAAAVYSRL